MGVKIRGSILIATSNKHKVIEMNTILRECGISLIQASIPKLEIQSTDICEVASMAALYAYTITHKPVLVEDAGLYIDVLNGFPGPYSSYIYKTIGIGGILKLMSGSSDRRALFRSCIALAYRNGIKVFEGTVEGIIANEPRGKGGFGFDPIFIPVGEARTFAEMSIEEKNKLSHRGIATRKLCEWIKENMSRVI